MVDHTATAPARPRIARCQTAALVLALVAATLVAYAPAITAGYIWDDDVHVTNNPTLHDASGLGRIWFDLGAVPQYYPLVHTTFWVEHRLWGLQPAGYHIVNVLLHCASALLLWIALRRLGLAQVTAWLAAAVFALHPVHVESVAWITERKNVLSLVFYLAALLAYLQFDGTRAAESESRHAWRWYGLSLTLFAGALLSKTVTCSLPAAILVLIWWKRGRLRLADIGPTLPMFALGLAFAGLTAWMEREVVGAKGSEWDYSLIERILIAGRAVWFYAWSLVWPVNLAFVYPRWTIDAQALWQWLFPIAAAALLLALWAARHRLGRGPLAAALLFGGTLVPALGFFDVYPFRFSLVADHFQYHASIAAIVLAVAAIDGMQRRIALTPRPAIIAIWSAVLVALAARTWDQTRIYSDERTLWLDTISKNPESFLAHGNLAALLHRSGEIDEAVRHYERALQLNAALPQVHNALGVIAAERGDLDKAMAHFRTAIDIEPGYAEPYNGLGAALARQGRFEEALPLLHRALELMPQFTDARLNLGLALIRVNQRDAAAEHFSLALKFTPDHIKANFLMGNLLAEQGQDEAAVTHLAKVVHVSPYRVQANIALGAALARLNRLEEAAACLREALRLAPNHPQALKHLQAIENQPRQ